MNVSPKVYDRLVAGLKRFQPILAAAKARDATEADTSTIVKDLLSEVFGYDKYAEITAEYAIKGTYCDLAVKLEGKPQILIEVKAIGLDLKEAHTRQAVDYAVRLPVSWVFLTNGAVWRIYHVLFGPPISPELVYECDLLSMSPKNRTQAEHLFLFAKEGQCKSVLDDFDEQRQATDPYFLGSLILSDAVLDVVKREVRRVFPDVKIDPEKLKQALSQQVLKREVAEGEKAEDARKKIARAQGKALRAKSKAAAASTGAETGPAVVVEPPPQSPRPEG
jgi:hypothetical protein